MKLYRLMIAGVLLFGFRLMGTGIHAQDAASCPTIVQQALETTDVNCVNAARNQICYGNNVLQIKAQPGFESLPATFMQPGDMADIDSIQALRLSPMDEATQSWGVALMRLQANLPDTVPGQNVVFLLFGDVYLADEAGATGTAFYFKSGVDDAPCVQAPNSGILIQTPEGMGEITLRVNEVAIRLHSTAYLTAQPSAVMSIYLIEGLARVTAAGVEQIVPAGTFVTIPLGDDLAAAGPPSKQQPYDFGVVEPLPIESLHPNLSVIAPMTPIAPVTPTAPLTPTALDAVTNVTPLAGDWLYTTGTITTGAGCPQGFSADLFPSIQQVISMPVDFDYASAMQIAGQTIPEGMTFSNPEPGVWVMDFATDGGSVHTEQRVQSSTRIEGETRIDADGCVITLPFTMERVEP